MFCQRARQLEDDIVKSKVVTGVHAVVQTQETIAYPTLCVLGLGYIGLPTCLAFAHAGHQVVGVDVNAETVRKLNAGELHLHEEGLENYYQEIRDQGNFTASLEPSAADVYLICVPTPIQQDKRADLSYVESASKMIAKVLRPGDLVILESTVPPRTCLDVIAPIIETECGLRQGLDYDLAHCPERVIPGRILLELRENARVIGGTTPSAAQRAAKVYRSFVEGDLMLTDATTAEMVKLMENTFRDVNIALANEFYGICESLGIDGLEAISYANRHPRVNIHKPGIGVGGHCIPIDPWFIVEAAPELSPLILQARKINDQRPHDVAERILCAAKEINAERIALLGLAFKPDIDDLRESPAVEVAALVANQFGGEVLAVEPFVHLLPKELSDIANISLTGLDEALLTADLTVALVDHSQFRNLNPQLFRSKRVLDPAHLWPKRTN